MEATTTTSIFELVRKPDGSFKINGDERGASIRLISSLPGKPLKQTSARANFLQTPSMFASASSRISRAISFDDHTVLHQTSSELPAPPRSARAIDTSYLRRVEDFGDGQLLSPVTPKFSCKSSKIHFDEGEAPEFQFFADDQDDVQVNFLNTSEIHDRKPSSVAVSTSAARPPPPSPSTPTSPSEGRWFVGDTANKMVGAGDDGDGDVGSKDNRPFGESDEATQAISELNTPSPRVREMGMTSASKSSTCVIGFAMCDVHDDKSTTSPNTDVPKASPQGRIPRSQTWPKLRTTDGSNSDSEDEVVKRFAITHKLGKVPSLVCRVTTAQPSTRSTDAASRWWWLLLISAFMFSSTSGLLIAGPRLFARGAGLLTTSTEMHSSHNVPTDRDEAAQFAHFTNYHTAAVVDVGANPYSGAHPYTGAGAGMSIATGEQADAAGAQNEEEAMLIQVSMIDPADGGRKNLQLQSTICKSVVASMLVSEKASLQAHARRDRVMARIALREAARKRKELLPPQNWTCNEYGCFLRDETADGVAGEFVYTVLSVLPLSEPQKLVARSILGNILFNTTASLLGGGLKPMDLPNVFREWISDRSNVPKALMRHAFIPAVTHVVVHGIGQMATALAAHAESDLSTLTTSLSDSADVVSALERCASSVACMEQLHATLLPQAMDALDQLL